MKVRVCVCVCVFVCMHVHMHVCARTTLKHINTHQSTIKLKSCVLRRYDMLVWCAIVSTEWLSC